MSLKNFFVGRAIGLLAVLIIGGAAYFFFYHAAAPEQIVANLKQYSSTEYGISFLYPDTYAIAEHDADGSALRKEHAIVLIPKANLPLPENSDGPPTITIEIYQNNLDHQTTEDWIQNSSASNFKLGEGTLASTTISGLPAFSYRWSGLYEGTTIALAQPNWVYAFSVTYPEMGAPIVQDFVTIRDSIRIVK